jgi:hypothetical protein
MFNIEEKIKNIATILSEFRRMDLIIYNSTISQKQNTLVLKDKKGEEVIRVFYNLDDSGYLEKITIDILELKFHEIAESIAQKEKGILLYFGRVLGNFEGILKKPKEEETIIQRKMPKEKIDIREIKDSLISEIHEIEQGVWDVFVNDIPDELKPTIRKIIQVTALTMMIKTLQKLHTKEKE